MALKDIVGAGPSTKGYQAAQLVIDLSTTARRKIDRLQEFVDDNGVTDVSTDWEAASPGATQEAVDLLANTVLVANHNLPTIGPDGGTGFAITATTITRNDGGDWIEDKFKTGSFVMIANAEDVANDGVHQVTGVTATVLTLGNSALTPNTADTTVTFGQGARVAPVDQSHVPV
ncbi:hypothetical protein LCGC14_0979410 [marine sediment metagenome]|uniref:Uncharacterized protein n=1 Tax=marine sediment metagenome TaxID=412755 RepID=A0A0F9QSI5_9ZZZZ